MSPDNADWYVYIIRCGDGSLYTGIARNLNERIKSHNTGEGGRYTRSHLPVELVYSESAADRSNALRREHAIKQLSRASKLALIGQPGR
ncbi:MAG: GIY-YIG nuclease family protein [Gammaproteobacteria bacterium]|jgi:putative endonuclease|nr:GIY-YIG nuclease family protein [Gammaproteobacteria bacterium]MDP7094097.1 GIY-YIG nuclease family protein [Gammaproteobacteria bacterium]MDP7270118.1 GIY-YIG nuclease family protein [Gammaproteobacteria bacterium]HJP04131.1 GIY-YIG nuclease family protein [Gammaproteobacteria bacterium]